MANVIATIWDFDSTLIKGNMQEPLFKAYNINPGEFWKETSSLTAHYQKLGYEINPDSFYLNMILRYVKQGKLAGLNNQKLREIGQKMDFYPGVVELFKKIDSMNVQKKYLDHDIKFESYIVSMGLKKIIEGCTLNKEGYIKKIWGCEFIEDLDEPSHQISEVGYSIDNTTKTRAIFEINKGVGIGPTSIDVNSSIPEDQRRVPFASMIYIADGPSDVPAFSLVKQKGGKTFAVYPESNSRARDLVETLRRDGRIDMYSAADYSKGSIAYTWIIKTLEEQAEKLITAETRI